MKLQTEHIFNCVQGNMLLGPGIRDWVNANTLLLMYVFKFCVCIVYTKQYKVNYSYKLTKIHSIHSEHNKTLN